MGGPVIFVVSVTDIAVVAIVAAVSAWLSEPPFVIIGLPWWTAALWYVEWTK